MKNTKELGSEGEIIAINFLTQKGYKILDRNWHFGHLEIDIICLNNNILVFVEVKSRNSDYVVKPELSLSKKQQSNLIKAANTYIDIKNIENEARFDIVSVVTHPEGKEIKHIKEAFYPYHR